MKQVKCVKLGEGVDYLTEGKIYEVEGLWSNVHAFGFNIKDDEGDTLVCNTPVDLHAEWEVVA